MDAPSTLRDRNRDQTRQARATRPAAAAEGRDADPQQRSKLLESCGRRVREDLERAIERAVEDLPALLTTQALKATRTDQQRALLDGVSLLQRQGARLAGAFRARYAEVYLRLLHAAPRETEHTPAVSTDFTADQLTLLSEDDLQDRLVLSRLAQRTRSAIEPEQTLGIRARLAALMERTWFGEDDHPLSPVGAFEALHDTLRTMAPGAAAQQALLTAFEPYVTRALVSAHDEVNGMLRAAGVLPRVRTTVTRSPDTPDAPSSAAAGESSAAGSGNSGGRRAGPPIDDPVEVSSRELNALHSLLASALSGQSGARGDVARMLADPTAFVAVEPMVEPVTGSLLDSLSALQHEMAQGPMGSDLSRLPALMAQGGTPTAPLDRVTMELVGVVFDFIDSDRNLNRAVKDQLLRLQVVGLKAALLDRSFFARREHPMRELMDRIIEVAADPDANLIADGPLVTGLTRLVDDLVARFDRDLTLFDEALLDVEELVWQESGRRAQEMQYQLSVAEREEVMSMAVDRARAELGMRIEDDTPVFVREFLLRWWTSVVARSEVAAVFRSRAADAATARRESGDRERVRRGRTPRFDADRTMAEDMTLSAEDGAQPEAPAASASTAIEVVSGLPPEARVAARQAIRVAEFLIWSVLPKHPGEVALLAQLLPRLIRSVDEAARAIDVPNHEREGFMMELMEAHGRAIQSAKDWRRGQPDPRRDARVRLLPDGSVYFERLAELAGEQNEAHQGEGVPPALAEWAIDDRIELLSEEDHAVAYKLTWISPARKLYVLSRHHNETVTLAAPALAGLVEAGKARRLGEAPAVDQVIVELTR